MTGEESGIGGLDEPINLHVCITKIMKPLIVIVPVLVMFTIIYIQVMSTYCNHIFIQKVIIVKPESKSKLDSGLSLKSYGPIPGVVPVDCYVWAG